MKGNTVSIKGNVTRDCEVRRTQSGRAVVSWGIAWNSSRKNQNGEWEDVPHYFDCQCWVTDRQLDMVEPSLVKGARCAIVDGHLEYQSWESQGQKRSRVVITVDDPIGGMLVNNGGNSRQNRDDGPRREDYGRDQYADEDIPF